MGFNDDFDKKVAELFKEANLHCKAKEIAEKLGKEELVNKNCSNFGKYYHNYVYEGYGLKIVKLDPDYNNRESVSVYYKRQEVLADSIYIPGAWEDILLELYKSIGAIQNERKKEEQRLERMSSILRTIERIPDYGEVNIGDGIKIAKYARRTGYYDENFSGIECYVYKNDELVFESFDNCSYGSNGPKHKTYIPGSWEEKVRQYAEYAERLGKQRKQQEAKNEADEEIKRLRKLRGED